MVPTQKTRIKNLKQTIKYFHTSIKFCKADLVIFQKGPEFFQAIEMAGIVVSEGLLLEVVENSQTKLLLKTVAVEPEETFQSIPGEGMREGESEREREREKEGEGGERERGRERVRERWREGEREREGESEREREREKEGEGGERERGRERVRERWREGEGGERGEREQTK